MDRNIEHIIDLEMREFDDAHHKAKRYLELDGEYNWMGPINKLLAAEKSVVRWRIGAGLLAAALIIALVYCLNQSRQIDALTEAVNALGATRLP